MSRKLAIPFAATLAIAAALAIAACGEEEEETTGEQVAAGQETDGAFIASMVPHHEMAIEMAEIAQEEADHQQISALADEIVKAQQSEINQMEEIHARIFGGPLEDAEHGTLGLDEHTMGMDMEAHRLEGAKPFDQAFIDMMIPHHQGAIRMARIELEQGEDPELMQIASAIVDAQTAEIEEMNEWREDWYGEPSPAGGVPSEDEEGAVPSHEMMGH